MVRAFFESAYQDGIACHVACVVRPANNEAAADCYTT
jgi:hypothetical protein